MQDFLRLQRCSMLDVIAVGAGIRSRVRAHLVGRCRKRRIQPSAAHLARLTWRFRSRCCASTAVSTLLQTGVPFSQTYMEATLNRYPADLRDCWSSCSNRASIRRTARAWTARAVVDLRPRVRSCRPSSRPITPAALKHVGRDNAGPKRIAHARGLDRDAQIDACNDGLAILLESVASLDEDRILRSYIGVIGATLRTSYYQLHDGKPREYISFKFDAAKVLELPKPRPYREIFVYAPRVEGVHLRFGAVARGGLRWSDRREDFRTEVLGLVKAQMVKNTVRSCQSVRRAASTSSVRRQRRRSRCAACRRHRLLQAVHQRPARASPRQHRRWQDRAPMEA